MLYEHGYDLTLKSKKERTILEDFLVTLRMPPYLIIEWIIIHGADVNCPFHTKDPNNQNLTIKQYIVKKARYYNTKLEKIVQKYLI